MQWIPGDDLRLKKRFVKAAFTGSVLYALLGAIGSQIDASGHVTWHATGIGFLFRMPIAFLILALLFCGIAQLPARKTYDKGRSNVLLASLFLFLCWTPMFLIQYPGSFMYDTQRQVFQIASGEYDAFHPLLHTILLRACLSLFFWLQSIEKCAALYSLLQMVVMSLCFSMVCCSLRRMAGRKAYLFSLLFYGLYPSHMAMASNYVKDALFAACLSVFLMLSLEEQVLGIPMPKQVLRLLFGVLACLLRNNMLPAILLWGVLLFFSKRTRRAAMIAFLIAGISLIANEALIRATDAKRGSVGEMLSVPIQQLARARLTDEIQFSEEEKQILDSFFNKKGWRLYEPTLADPVKEKLKVKRVSSQFREFALLWLSIGKKCPQAYLEAFLHLALPSFYPYHKYRVAQPYLETGLQPGVVTAPFGQPPMTQPERFSVIRSWLTRIVFNTGADGVPLLRWIFNTGAVFWFLLFCLLAVIAFGHEFAYSVLLLPFLLYGTFLLGPVMQGRYLYPFVSAIPLFVLAVFPRFKGHCERKDEFHDSE